MDARTRDVRMRDIDMLSALVSAPGTMARNAGLYITVFVVALAQALIAQYVPDALTLAEQAAALSPDTLGGNILSLVLALLVVLVEITLSVYVLATVANVTNPQKNKMLAKNTNASLGALAAFAALVLVVGGALLVAAGWLYDILTTSTGIISTIIMILLLIALLALFGGIVLFGFTPAYMGHGFALREALARSWKISTTHVLGMVILFLALIFISGITSSVTALITENLENEWVYLLVNTALSAMFAFYGATVLANAIPAAENTLSFPSTSTPRHRRTH